jgi:hypothetical protein
MNNVVGKILIVMQLVFSLCFMCFAGAVYTFQAGWKSKAAEALNQLATARQQVDDIQGLRQQENETLTADLKAQTSRADVAEAKITQLETDLKQAQGNLANAEAQRDKHLADLVVAQQETQARIAESRDAQSENNRLRDRLSEGIALRRQLEDNLLEKQGMLDIAEERERHSLERITQLIEVLRYNKLDPDEAIAGPVPPPIDKVTGVVKESRKNDSRTAEYVQVSVGSDDKIQKRMRLIVYRGAKYICEVEVTDVYPDAAVARVLEDTRNGNIERGDNVTTKL